MTELEMIGRWVERERKAREWTCQELADRAGVSRNTLLAIEAGANAHISSTFGVIAALDGILSIRSAKADTRATT